MNFFFYTANIKIDNADKFVFLFENLEGIQRIRKYHFKQCFKMCCILWTGFFPPLFCWNQFNIGFCTGSTIKVV